MGSSLMQHTFIAQSSGDSETSLDTVTAPRSSVWLMKEGQVFQLKKSPGKSREL